jgi:hypothetical protein
MTTPQTVFRPDGESVLSEIGAFRVCMYSMAAVCGDKINFAAADGVTMAIPSASSSGGRVEGFWHLVVRLVRLAALAVDVG